MSSSRRECFLMLNAVLLLQNMKVQGPSPLPPEAHQCRAGCRYRCRQSYVKSTFFIGLRTRL